MADNENHDTIDALQWEKRKFPPSDAFKKNTLVAGTFLYEEANEDYEAFWARQASEKNIFTTVLLFAEKRGILLSGQDVEVLLSATLDEVLAKALWIGSTNPRQRWIGLYEKLDKHGKETIQMATRSTRSLRD